MGIGLGFELKRAGFRYVNPTDLHCDDVEVSIDCVPQATRWTFKMQPLEPGHVACVARGHPSDAWPSYRSTLPYDAASYSTEVHQGGLQVPHVPFEVLQVRDLVPEDRRQEYDQLRG